MRMRRVCRATRLGRAAAVRCTGAGRRLITGMVVIMAAMAATCLCWMQSCEISWLREGNWLWQVVKVQLKPCITSETHDV